MNRHIVLCDSGFLKYSTRFAARARLKIANDAPLTELAEHPKAKQAIFDVLSVSMKYKLGGIESNFGKIDRCIVCLDIGDSWRINVPKTIIPGTEQASSIAYKGHRRTDDPEELAAQVKLNAIYKDCIELLCSNSGIELVGKYSIEADDFMIVLAKTYADQGDTVFIMSRDEDITQALHTSETGGTVMILQPVEHAMRLVVNHATYNSVKEASIFSMPKWTPKLAEAIGEAMIIAPQYMLLNKILRGDVSDDISPIMMRITVSKSGKEIHHNLPTKAYDEITTYFSQQNPEGYFKIENCYNDADIHTILSIMHQAMFKTSFDDLAPEWQKFYYDKFCENRKMVVVNKQELGDIYDTVLKCAVEQLHGITPTFMFPTWDALERLKL